MGQCSCQGCCRATVAAALPVVPLFVVVHLHQLVYHCCCWLLPPPLLPAGWFEYTYDYVAGEAIREADAEGKHVVDPYTYSLKFYKPAEGSY